MKKKRANPELGLQIRVRRMLMTRAPADLFWIGGAAGLRLTPVTLMKAKASGVLRRGWPDLTFMRAGRCYFIELKKDTKSPLSAEQAAFMAACDPLDNYAVCCTIEGVEAMLDHWGIELKPEMIAPIDDGLSFAEAFD